MNLPKDKKIVLFDGYCNYCDDKVNYIIKKDKKDIFRFVSIQSNLGKEIIQYIGINPEIDSIILYEPGTAYYIKSEAVFKILKYMFQLHFLLIFSYLPKFITDYLYDFFAKKRYSWYGKKESCSIPTDEIKSKFLSE